MTEIYELNKNMFVVIHILFIDQTDFFSNYESAASMLMN